MKNTKNILTTIALGWMATCGVAQARPNFVPEPDSIGLVALGVAALVLFARRNRK